MRPAVLLADDSALVRAMATRLLEARGFAVTALPSFREAEAVDPSGFSVALLDLELGDGLGPDLARLLRARVPELPIAFVTAGAPPELLERASRLGPVFTKERFDDAVRWVVAAGLPAR